MLTPHKIKLALQRRKVVEQTRSNIYYAIRCLSQTNVLKERGKSHPLDGAVVMTYGQMYDFAVDYELMEVGEPLAEIMLEMPMFRDIAHVLRHREKCVLEFSPSIGGLVLRSLT